MKLFSKYLLFDLCLHQTLGYVIELIYWVAEYHRSPKPHLHYAVENRMGEGWAD